MIRCELEPLAFTDTKDTEGHYHELVNANPNYPILIRSVLWLSVENFMQAQKFQGTPLATKIQKTYDTEQAKSLERNSAVLDFVRHDWHKIRDEIMLEGLRAKFTQHKDLKKLLLRTGSRDIVLKDSIPGSYWGRGSDGMGTNKLGQLLMRTRAEMLGKTPTIDTDTQIKSEFQGSPPTSPAPDKPPKGTIYFHDDKYPFFEFSPYFPHEVRINGTKWRTVSHYYLGQRFAGSKLEARIQECRTAGEAMKIAYSEENHDFVRTDWKDVKDQVMKTALKAKFIQYPEAKHLLLSTGHKELVHHCNDTYWGDGMDGDGQNMLGNFLMDIRKELQEKDSDVRPILQSIAASNQMSPQKDARKSRHLASLHRDTNTSIITSEHSNELYGLSVYSDHQVTVAHKRWPSLAHFYNAMKFEGTRLEDRIRAIPSPDDVPYVAYQYRDGVVKGWAEKRDRIMMQGLRAKFDQHSELVELLVGTSRRLVFHSEEDAYYGDGGDGSGQNRLGTLLEELRSEFQASKRHQEASRTAYHRSPPQEAPITRSLTSLPYHSDVSAPFDTSERMRFSALDKQYSCFLPSSDHPIVTQDGRKWYSVEHFYHASKFHGGQFDDMISRESSLEEVRKLVYSNMYQRQVRSDFGQVKDNYMLHGLRLKFEQHESLRRFLLQSGTATLIYDTEKDEYWGYGIAGSGKNRLGGLLMLVRKEFQELSRVEWQYQQRHNSPPNLRQARTMTFADNPRDLLDRFIPSHSHPPALTHQQSFYDTHTSPKQLSPKPPQRPSFQHQESFVLPTHGRGDTFGKSDTFGFSSMKGAIGEIGRSNDTFIDPSVISTPPRFDANEQSFSVTDDFLLANRQRGSYLRKQRSLSNPDLCDLK